MRRVGHGFLLAETASGEGRPALVFGQVHLGQGVRVAVDQSAATVSVMLALLCRGVQAVGVAVDEGDRAETVDALLGVVGQDGLRPAALRGGLDAGLEVGAVVANQGGAGGMLEGGRPVLVVAHQVDGRLRALKEGFPFGDVGGKGLSAFGIVAHATAEGSEVEAVAEVDADGRLVVLDELDEGLDGVLVGHVAVVVAEGDEAGRGAHLLAR